MRTIKLELTPISEDLAQTWERACGYHLGVDQLLYGRDIVRECMHEHPTAFPEVSWDGTQFRILPDDWPSE